MPTLSQFLQQHLAEHQLPAELGSVVSTIVQACQAISGQVRQGALAGVLGEAGSSNVQDEAQKKLDVIANQILIDALCANPAVAGLASEEEEQFVSANDQGRYLVLFDPLDGSSNIDINISVGTIFSILEKPAGPLSTQSFLQSGRAQVASGYTLYGPQTQLVLCLRHGVAVFTLDAGSQFVQTQLHWQPPMQQYIAELLAGETGPRGKNYNMRWVASMVAEIHRILMRGGIFMYPKDARDPAKPGKLRLMYEANPLSLIIEQAGGASTNARESMLDIQPEGLHQRVAVIMGSREEVDYATRLHQQ